MLFFRAIRLDYDPSLREEQMGLGTDSSTEVAAPCRTVSPASGAVRAEGSACGFADRIPSDLRAMRLHEAVARQAARRGEACAIVFEGMAFSYTWLDARADRLAAALIGHGVRPGEAVGVHMRRGPEMVAAMLAVLKVGGAYLPLDPDYPEARLKMILADAAPIAVLTESDLMDALDTGETLQLRCDEVSDVGSGRPSLPRVGADALAYVLYTSGSTGRPKGVEIGHGAVMNLLASFLHRPGFTERDTMLAATTTAFDISVLELFLPLVAGGRMVLASSEAAKDPYALAALIDADDCTVVQGTSSRWRFLIDAGWRGRADLTVICGGEALTRELADRLLTRCGALWNVYGPTETTVWSTLARVQAGSDIVPIGFAIEQTSLHVLDEAGAEVADGGVGELYIGGAGLARGYRGQPELTRDRFASRLGRRLYRTSDLARRREDGALECLGRTDDQVKVRGFRIELGEVDAALSRCPELAWGVAVALTDGKGETTLVAYVGLRDGAAPEPAALRRALAASLPDYMIPHRFVRLEAMPMTPSGKVDRNALAGATDAVELESDAARAPMNAVENRLADIWRSVLGLTSVSASDNFFDLGGYSLLTLTLLKRVEAEFGRRLTMADLFACKDLRATAAELERECVRPASRGIPVQPLGARPPLVWFDVGPQLRGLAARLAPDQPFIGLNLEPQEERDLLATPRVHAAQVAERLVTALRTIQPQGPYRLGGWCRWGVMAYAAACQLEAEGEAVTLLVMLDAANMHSPYRVLKRTSRLARRGLEGLPIRATRRRSDLNDFGEMIQRSADRYRPPSYSGAVLLLRAQDAERDWDGASGWHHVVKGALEVVDLPGDHAGILTSPHVDHLSQALRAGLRRVQPD